jgi:hypothetical protein
MPITSSKLIVNNGITLKHKNATGDDNNNGGLSKTTIIVISTVTPVGIYLLN